MRGPLSLPLAPRLGQKKPQDWCAALRSSRTARYPGCRKAGRACNDLWYLVLFNCLQTIVGNAENARDGDRSIACDRRLFVLAEIDVLLRREPRSCVVGPRFAWLCPNLGTWNDCRCTHFRVSKICRYGLAVLSTCSWSHLRDDPTAPVLARRRRSRNCHLSTSPPCCCCFQYVSRLAVSCNPRSLLVVASPVHFPIVESSASSVPRMTWRSLPF